MADKAKIAKVDYGVTVIDGLLLSNGDYAVAVPQICEFFQFAKNQASRDFKAILGKDFSFDKCTSELNFKAVNIVNLTNFAKIKFHFRLTFSLFISMILIN